MRRLSWLSAPVIGWVLYDFANTIFSYAVITRYFNDWIINDRGAPDYYTGLMSLGVSVALVASLPFFGALADETGHRKPYLIGFTLVSVVMTALLGLTDLNLPLTLILGGLAIYGFNSALAHYDPLLAKVTEQEHRPKASGLGVGMGYLGVAVASVVLSKTISDNQEAFLPTALMFLAFSLPCFWLVKEGDTKHKLTDLKQLIKNAGRDLKESVARARHNPYGRFLVARFFYVDAIATVIAYMTVYAKRAGLSEAATDKLLLFSILFSMIGAFSAGFLATRIGPKKVLQGTLILVIITLLLAGISGLASMLWLAGPMVGFSLGAVWTSDRVLLMSMVEEKRRGEVFGLYALVGKVSSGFGPLVLWGGTVWLLASKLEVTELLGASRIALCVLAGAALLGLAILRRVKTD